MREEHPASTPPEERKASPKCAAFSGIKARLITIILLVLIPILLFQAWFFYGRYQYQKGLELHANLEIARALAKAFDGFVADVLRQELAIGIAATASPPLSPSDLTRLLVESADGYSATVRAFSWVSPQGRVLASSNPEVIGMNISDRPYFSEIVSGKEWLVTDLLGSRLKGEEGEPIFWIARSIRDSSGNLLGIALASVVPSGLDKIMAIERSKGAGVSLVDSKGIHVRRYPYVKLTSEQISWLRLYPVVGDALKGKEVSTTVPSSVTGSMRLAGFVPVPSTGWVTAASRDEGEVVEPIISAILKQAALFLLVAVASLWAALRLARIVTLSAKTLQKHALSLAHGEVETPVLVPGPAEFQNVAQAFNAMAGKVHSREEALRESEDRYRDLVEHSQDLICTHDLDGTILSINPRPAELLGYSPKELLGMNVRDILIPEVSPKFESYLDEIKRSHTARGLMYVQTKKGEQRIWEYDNSLRTEGVKQAIVRGMAHDVTEQKRAQAALKRSRDELELRVKERTAELTRANTALKESERQLKVLSSRLLSAQEDERSRVACEIHDSVGQSLHSIKSGMKNLHQQMREILSAPELEHALEDLMQVVDYSIEEVKAVYMGLRPLLLDDLGILATMNWFLRECRKTRPEITIESEIGIREEEVPEPLKIVIFRLLQAAMDNVTRHSRAEIVYIRFERVNGRVDLRVEDNGLGFSMEDVASEKKPGEALGIAIMQERVESSGGIFTVRSSKGQGTAIRAFWDLGRYT